MEASTDAAMPALGISLLDADDSQGSVTELLPSGCEPIDAALSGGVRYQEITAIAAFNQESRSVLTLHFIASHLLSQPSIDVVVLDTTGAFAVEQLRDILAQEIRRQSPELPLQHTGYVYDTATLEHEERDTEILDRTTALLDRVRISRIFDITGLVEVIGEIRRVCDAERNRQEAGAETQAEPQKERTRFGMVVIDDLSSLLGPLIASNNTEAQALLASIHRSLMHLAKRYGLCVLLLNGVVGSGKGADYSAYNQGSSSKEEISIFPSVTGKPALGRTLAHLVDTSIMLSKLPKATSDAEAVVGGGPSAHSANAMFVEILEVLKNRTGAEQDRVAAFEIVDGWNLAGFVG